MRPVEAAAGHRSGYVAVGGRPNVGKSTLINAFLGETVAAVSRKPQTTRTRQLGVLTLPAAQVVFVDTPGIHHPYHKLGERMNRAAAEALQDADAIVVLFDASEPPTEDDERVAGRLAGLDPRPPIVIALNKIDLIDTQTLEERRQAFGALISQADAVLSVSATRGDGRGALLERLLEILPEGPRYYPEDQLTDLYERDIAADLIRAAAMELLREEVPYGIGMRIDKYEEQDDAHALIEATIFVEKESHKGIVIGKGGSMIRAIGTRARREIEAMTGRQVYLRLRVKTLAGWTDDEAILRRFGT